jgi:hypothetical protein
MRLHRQFPRAVLGVTALAALIGGVGRVEAGMTISYEYETTLTLASGTDTLGLNGATLDIKVDVSSGAVYVSRFGFPAVVMNDDATVTISGSSIPSNDGMFALSPSAFAPTFAGLFDEPSGLNLTLSLPVGGTLELDINTNPSVHGSGVKVGDTVNILDFAPATSKGLTFTASNAEYNQVNPTVTATLSAVPEPSSAVLASIGAVVAFVIYGSSRHRREQQRQAAA